jgi:hypothetical protein
MNKYSGVNDNTALFDRYAREIVDKMLLYNSITMAYKSLYIDGVFGNSILKISSTV